MKFIGFVLLNVVILQFASSTYAATNYTSFFYYVEQWPGSYCNTKQKCCYPSTEKPAANFSINALRPVWLNPLLWPEYCDDDGNFPYDVSQISDLVDTLKKSWPTLACPKNNGSKLWGHEWEKYGTCTIDIVLDQHAYFESALTIKNKVNYLQLLKNAGIEPNGQRYKIEDIKKAIVAGVGHTPVIECNKDENQTVQLYRIYICVDATGKQIIKCPITLKKECNSTVLFPPF